LLAQGETMTAVEQARAILHITKALRAFSADEPAIVQHFCATRIAGKAALFASSIRGSTTPKTGVRPERLRALSAGAGLDLPTFDRDVKPWLVKKGLAYFDADATGQEVLVANVLTYDALLAATSDLFTELGFGTNTERACQLIVHVTSQVPTAESDLLQAVSLTCGEEDAVLALDLARGFRLVSCTRRDSGDPSVYYCERVWKGFGAKGAKAITSLSPDDRSALEVMVDMVRQYQGYPRPLLAKWALQNNVERILKLAIGVGIMTSTAVVVAQDMRHEFVTTPHFYADVEEQFGEDACDRVKLFLDSIRHGQHFALPQTGRIFDPTLLLQKLVNTGVVGPCTAIGSDYTMAERAGIIRVERALRQPGQYEMFVVQEDVVKKTLEVVQRKTIAPQAPTLDPGHFRDNGRFMSIPESRASLAELPGHMKEAEERLVQALREG
jgi:hypothetical protein